MVTSTDRKMGFSAVDAKDCRSSIAADGCATHVRADPVALARRCRGAAHGGAGGKRAAGFTYIGLLILVAMMGIALTLASELWQTAQKREKEQELLFVGNQFRRALALYTANGGGSPKKLEDLLKDPRVPGVRRFLRKIYRDPITGSTEWGLVRAPGDVITGVYSLSNEEPLKQSEFSLADQAFKSKKKYSEWVFLPQPGQGTPGASQSDATPNTSQPRVRR